jgi:tetratricopeptide (TPR) repeat protein
MLSIVVRKFSALANLDIESMPAEKESRFKERIISNRLKRNLTKWGASLMKVLRFIAQNLGKGFSYVLSRLDKMKDKYQEESILNKKKQGDPGKLAEQLFLDADALIKDGSLEEAEKKFIEIISLQSRSLKAFKKLADLYILKKQFDEAKQTLEHILKLIEDEEVVLMKSKDEGSEDQLKTLNLERGQIHFDLASVFRGKENLEQAGKSMKEALKIEPSNPKYLDTMIEISIMGKDKIAALDAFKALEKANPENQKLAELKEQISEL